MCFFVALTWNRSAGTFDITLSNYNLTCLDVWLYDIKHIPVACGFWMDSVIRLSPMILSVWWASNGVSSYWLSRLLHFSSGLGLCFWTNPIVFRVYTSSLGLSLLNVFRKFLHPQPEVRTQSVISLLFQRNCVCFPLLSSASALFLQQNSFRYWSCN